MFEIFQTYGLYLWLALAVIVLLLVIWLITLQVRVSRSLRHYQTLTQGVQAGNLETVLEQQVGHFQEAAAQIQTLNQEYQRLAADMQRAIQRVGVVRFNPFQDVGGDQSFAIALLDAQGNGLLITSLYGRSERRLYVKPVQAGRSTTPLSDEEKKAIQQAGVEGEN